MTEEKLRHPRGLYTLFFTEMWERFSYYGMRALLTLFMVDAVRGGPGFSDETATAIYGLYTAFVYLLAVPGGWIADRLLGAQRSIWYGGIIIALGHFTLAIPRIEAFFIGLILVVSGTGLLKPNISAIVGQLYPEGGSRRDAGFTIFYMGINLGAALGPIVCSTLGEKHNWHYGFAAAGVGMVIGLVQFKLTRHHLGSAGLEPHPRHHGARSSQTRDWLIVAVGVGAIMVLTVLGLTGLFRPDPVSLAQKTTYGIAGLGALFFASVFLFGKLDRDEKRRLFALLILLMAAALFWSGFEQAGSSLNLFAERYTDRTIDAFNYLVPAGWFQFLNPAFILIFSPVFASLWLTLSRRHLNPPTPVKFAMGLILLALGFLVMVAAAKLVAKRGEVMPFWLIFTYLLHTWGELCLSPVGLSTVTKLAPERFVGQMMGLWFLSTSLGNLIAGLVAGQVVSEASQMAGIFMQVVWFALAVGVVLLILAKPIQKLMAPIK